MKKRALNGLLVSLVLLLINFLSSFIPLFNMYRKGLLTRTIFTENIVVGDYQSLLNIHIIVVIIFILMEDYINPDNNLIRIIRYRSVSNYCKSKIISTLPVIIYISTIHELISITFVMLFGDLKLALKYGFGYAVLLQILYISLYLTMVYITKEMLSIFMSKGLSMIATLVIYCLMFYVSMYLVPSLDVMYSKTALVQLICSGQMRRIDVLTVFLRSIGLTILIYYFYMMVRRKSDYFEN